MPDRRTTRGVAIVGTGQTRYQHRYPNMPYRDLVFAAVNRALEDACMAIDRVDAVVYPMAPDALIGVSHAERWAADAVGALGKPFMRVNTGGVTGLSAVQAGYDLVASGLYDVVMVAGADRVGESGEAQEIMNCIWDPFFERSLPLTTITMLAMQAVRFNLKYGADERDMAIVSARSHRNGVLNEYAHIQQAVTVEEVLASASIAVPIKLLDCCPQSSGGAALILCAQELAERFTDRPAWVRGVGHSSETYWIGDRVGPKAESDYAESPALERAANAAYAMAGLTPADMDVAELYAPFSNIEMHAVQDVGLCARGNYMKLSREGAFDRDGRIPINPSGGVLCANPISVTAMVRVIEAALQVRGRAGKHQIPNVHNAIATGCGGDHQYFGAVVVSEHPAQESR
ncbi:thiolase family protein [bacterium]|nr:MAG: thiolase family protein [bacterium]